MVNQQNPAETCKYSSQGVYTENIYLAPLSATMDSISDQVCDEFYGEHSSDAVPVSASVSCDQLHYISANWRRGKDGPPSFIRIQQANRGLQQQVLRKKRRRRYQTQYQVQERSVSSGRLHSQINQTPSIANNLPNLHESRRQRRRIDLRRIIASWFCRRASNFRKQNFKDGNIEAGEEDNADRFDHGSPIFHRTTDCPPYVASEVIGLRAQNFARTFWAEFFGIIDVILIFVFTFFTELYRFILYSIYRVIIVGLIQTTYDYLLKSLFSLAQIIFHSICNMFDRLAVSMGNIMKPFVECVRAFRIVEVKNLRKDFYGQQA